MKNYLFISFIFMAAIVLALPIYIGVDYEPEDKASNTSANFSYVYEEACIEAGEITEVQVYAHDVGGGTIDFGVFDKAGSNFTDDEYAEGLTLGVGLNTYTAPTDFTAMPIDVGQHIGFWAGASGRLERHDYAGAGYWYYAGDQIGNDSPATFTFVSDKDIQIRMKVTAIASTTGKKWRSGKGGLGKW